MTNGAKALIAWLNENVITSYQEPVPGFAVLPYASLGYVEGEFAEPVLQQITIWTRSDSSYASAYSYADTLSELLGENGVLLDGTGIKLWIKKGSPFVQNRNDDELTVRAVLINLEISYY
mgnify:CR=1 FL=1|jgi:hypothetical protein